MSCSNKGHNNDVNVDVNTGNNNVNNNNNKNSDNESNHSRSSNEELVLHTERTNVAKVANMSQVSERSVALAHSHRVGHPDCRHGAACAAGTGPQCSCVRWRQHKELADALVCDCVSEHCFV
jgi:hypothetical protein